MFTQQQQERGEGNMPKNRERKAVADGATHCYRRMGEWNIQSQITYYKNTTTQKIRGKKNNQQIFFIQKVTFIYSKSHMNGCTSCTCTYVRVRIGYTCIT